MKILLRCVAVAGLLVQTMGAGPAVADVPEQCVERFTNGGAIPGSAACLIKAATSSANLGNYWCSAEDAREFCGELKTCPAGYLPDYDTGECIDVGDPGGPDEGGPDGPGGPDEGGPDGPGGPDEGGPDEGGPDEGGPDEGGPEDAGSTDEDAGSEGGDDTVVDDDTVEVIIGNPSGEGNGAGGLCEYGLAEFGTGACPEPPVLQPFENYDETQGSSGTDCGPQSPEIPNIPGPVLFTTQGLQFVDSAVISNLGNIAAGISAINLVNAANAAEQSGDTSQVFQQAYDILFPLFPEGTQINDAFQMFSDYIDANTAGGCN